MTLWLIQLALSWALLSLIWVIQIVHYPTFNYLEGKSFRPFHRHHTRSISYIVMPLMVAELGLTGWMFWHDRLNLVLLLMLIAVVSIWCSTIFIQMPLHRQLAKRRTKTAIKELIQSNWIRTVLWTFKAFLVSYALLKNVMTRTF